MRLSFDGLAGKIAHTLGRDPYSGECFVFRSKCHLSAYWSQLVSGIKAPGNFRRNGATAFSAYWSQRSNVPFYVQKRLLNKAWAVMVRG
jgi:hypothetical protein